jgi:ABC-2 type transport system ATP-binding protein
VVSSHILTEISETCDRILVINQGIIGWQGSEAELSSQLSEGMRVQITLRVAGRDAAGAEARAREVLQALPAVQSVGAEETSEAGEDLVTLVVTAAGDPRDELCRTLVGAGISVLELGRRRELEGMFLELVSGEGSKKKRRPAEEEDGAGDEDEADETEAASKEDA